MTALAALPEVAPLAPPRDWFDAPEPDSPEPLTVDPDGRVHGHLALWDACHSGFVSGQFAQCVRPPQSRTGYREFHLGALDTAEGDTISVGRVVTAGGHAGLVASMQEAQRHYDNTQAVGAFVRARDGRHGIYLTGAARSNATPEVIRDMRANPPSGDWRGLNGNLEMVAALSVPVPGFQTPQLGLTAAGDIQTLILPSWTQPACEECEEEVEVMQVTDKGYLRKRAMLASALDGPVVYLDALALTAAATTFTAEQRRGYAKSGVAMPDGSYPIRNCQDWDDARRSIGRTPARRRPAVAGHIARRGKALGCGD